MRRWILSVALLFVSVSFLAACESKKEGAPAVEKAKEAPAAPAAPAEETALMSPASSAGRTENDEGVGHYKQGHWDVAEKHFRNALKADEKLAEGHFNLALALDKEGKHEEATTHFKKAAELGASNPAIKDSTILKKHTGM